MRNWQNQQHRQAQLDNRSKRAAMILVAVFLLIASSVMYAFSAGSGTMADNEVKQYQGVRVLTVVWTGDASDGSVPALQTGEINNAAGNLDSGEINGYVFQIAAIPGDASAPTNLYDVTLTNDDGIDITGGRLQNLSSSNSLLTVPAALDINGATIDVQNGVYVDGDLTVNVSNNSVNEATGTIKIYYRTVP